MCFVIIGFERVGENVARWVSDFSRYVNEKIYDWSALIIHLRMLFLW